MFSSGFFGGSTGGSGLQNMPFPFFFLLLLRSPSGHAYSCFPESAGRAGTVHQHSTCLYLITEVSDSLPPRKNTDIWILWKELAMFFSGYIILTFADDSEMKDQWNLILTREKMSDKRNTTAIIRKERGRGGGIQCKVIQVPQKKAWDRAKPHSNYANKVYLMI